MAQRTRLPEKLKQELLYESAFSCVVCQGRRVQIHHIDENNNNNDPDNLVVICHDHHDDAHAKRALSQNLTPARLKQFKRNWLTEVATNRLRTANGKEQQQSVHPLLGTGVSWGYINHRRVAQLIDSNIIRSVDQRRYDRCLMNGVIDTQCILVKPKGLSSGINYVNSTVYDWYEFGDSLSLHLLYSDLVDELVKKIKPIHIEESSWTKKFIRHCITDGSFIFFGKHSSSKKFRKPMKMRMFACVQKREIFLLSTMSTQLICTERLR